MKSICFICFIIVSLGSIIKAGDSPDTKPSEPPSLVSKFRSGLLEWNAYLSTQGDTSDVFDWSFLQLALLKAETHNAIISPLSVKYLLILLSEGASTNSKTKQELSTILGTVPDINIHRAAFKKIVSSLQEKSDSYDLAFESKIFVDQSIEPTQQFAAIAETFYSTIIERLAFSDAGRSADYINEWCSKVTKGNVQHLVESNDLTNSVMIMLNAIYFKGLWEQPFPRNRTTELPFHLSSTKQIKTKYIVQTARYYYYDSPQLESKIIRIPYNGKKFSMIIALPDSNKTLDDLIGKFNSVELRKVETSMVLSEVHLALPKFKFETTSNMNELVKLLGIKEIFTAQASLPLLAHGGDAQNQLRVSNIKQTAGIQVDEEGSIVYAATQVGLVNKFGDSVTEFIADRPFLFVIQDESTKTLLFGGKVGNPGEFEIPK